ncbi:MAG: acetate--CoA ligase [Pseudomonadota bacterium]|nr:acetate--CoA ligase [Pseudomonadota bacterium]MEC7091079.1 acetate--CoA ligase [Pseudomonadota bacterium]MEC7270142.1 acetate--CoA ligase [Pseudomonadota bacterium]MEC7928659.1 acetate--CoA ligase [Pseudomonadota bacterium]MEC8287621.1 acetate--CoA ligase [Pseudomonadota bacterium]|tara:strand:- start:393 stop:2348 length:1956 start_codon:yes stop_codon:yes gene_type:complete
MNDFIGNKVSKTWSENSHINRKTYDDLYAESIKSPEIFWGKHGQRIDWIKPYTKVKNTSYKKNNISIQWFEDGTLNISANCIDRHLKDNSQKKAIIWESDDGEVTRIYTYQQLYEEVSKFGNVLKNLGTKKGDRVTIYMPMIPEATFAMLACARVGAIHSVVFGGFSPEALAGRIHDCKSKIIITADEGIRGGKIIPLKANVDDAIKIANGLGTEVEKSLVIQRTGNKISWDPSIDTWYHEEIEKVSDSCPPEEMAAEDPLFILYTSGSTGKPKGVLHTSGGYIVYASMTHQYIFDYKPDDVYWCAADVGWITGHSYIVYGPLSNAATVVMYEGLPNHPNASRCWEIIDKYSVNIFYTAPTAIRALMGAGDEYVKCTDRSSLRLLGTVGEPINPEAWNWYFNVVGDAKSPIVDTWWQTETGGIMISPLPGAIDQKPGSATLPFFGIQPAIVDADGKILDNECSGNLVVCDSWPGQMRTVYGDHKRFESTYFSTYEGMYFTGDGCRRDSDGYYWITGRVDDVINVSGHRLGTAEVESALVSNKKVSESAVVGFPHNIKGQGIYAFVTLKAGVDFEDEAISKELNSTVREVIGPIASPDHIQITPSLPKTRSGKIMRRILRKIAENNFGDLGDTSTLADPTVVDDLINNRKNK